MTGFPRDMTPLVDLTRRRGTGAVRQRRPTYLSFLPPCNAACPAGENIQSWLALAQGGQFRAAWETLIQDNPLPAVHGRVCYHPCEDHCNRRELDSTVSIHGVERFLGDLALERDWPVPILASPSGKRVLIVGSGPAGLSAAFQLTRAGHQVEIRDAAPSPGGMLQFGIPAYRLPRDVLAREIARITRMGVTLTLDHRVEDLPREQAAGAFDAVFVAIGAQVSRKVDIPARDAVKVLDAVAMLRDMETGAPPVLGRRVVVYGGGNTAMDAARTARRLGADEAMIVYRRDRAHMPAHAFEADEAEAEGVRIKWLTAINSIDGGDVTVEVMRIDESGQAQGTGTFETLRADTVVLALGQETDSGFLHAIPGIEHRPDGTIVVDRGMMTGRPGVFAGGDMVPAGRSVAIAAGHGKKAARHIDAWLRGQTFTAPDKHPVIGFDGLIPPIYSDAAPSTQKELPVTMRGAGFDEVVFGLNEAEATHEAKRCLSCGNCYECDNCLAACPEHAIVKRGSGLGYRVDHDRCTGCAVCVEQCPCHAMEMVPEGT